MAIKTHCQNIFDLWAKGWICVPTSPYNKNDKFSSPLGRYIIDKFPGLEQKYERLCNVNKGDFALFKSATTKGKNPQKILMYNDLRIPLCADDFGLIFLPDSIENEKEPKDAYADWEIIEKSIKKLKENSVMIPNKIYMLPLGFGENKLTEEESIEDLMVLLLDNNNIEIIYGIDINIEEEDQDKEIEEEANEESKKEESIQEYSSGENPNIWDGSNLIDNEFEQIEIKKEE